MPMSIQSVQVNQDSSTQVRQETLQGREYLVVPMVALVEGVVNGGKVTRNEIAKSTHLWNGRPIPVGHPKKNGQDVSANAIEFERELNIGRTFNAMEKNGRLLMEGWIDVEHATNLGFTDVLERLRSNDAPMELSTAFYPVESTEQGTFKGRRYNKVLTNLKPDHVALLPNATGACSVRDGCGTPRVNTQDQDPEAEERFFKRLTKFLFSATRSTMMDKETREKHVNSLIANDNTVWDKDDKDTLLALSDEKLTALADECSCNKGNDNNNSEGNNNNTNNNPNTNNNSNNNNNNANNGDSNTNTDATASAVELAVQKAIQPLTERLDRVEAKDKEKHKETVERLVAHKDCTVPKNDLANMSLETLQSIESMLDNKQAGNKRQRNPYRPDFSGRGTSKLTNNNGDNKGGDDNDTDESWKSPPATLTSKPVKKDAS